MYIDYGPVPVGSMMENLVDREDRGTGSYGQRQRIGRMTEQGCGVMGLSNVDRRRYPSYVLISAPRAARALEWTRVRRSALNTEAYDII